VKVLLRKSVAGAKMEMTKPPAITARFVKAVSASVNQLQKWRASTILLKLMNLALCRTANMIRKLQQHLCPLPFVK
jgi:hypothetical protein